MSLPTLTRPEGGPFRGGLREPKLLRSLSDPVSLFLLARPESENSLATSVGVVGIDDPGVEARGPSSESIKLLRSRLAVPELDGAAVALEAYVKQSV